MSFSRKTLLQMDPIQFDQSEEGWRSLIGKIPEEEIAGLILSYIKLNKNKFNQETPPVDLLYFHAGQSFACAGVKFYKKAIQSFQKSYEPGKEFWNAYVTGTIAFLEGNKDEIDKQIKFIEDSKVEEQNKRGGNIKILKNFSKYLEQGITDYSKAYNIQVASH